MSRNGWILIILGVMTIFSVWVIWPQQPSHYLPGIIPWPERGWLQWKLGDVNIVRKGMTLGLDLQGGLEVVLEADLSQIPVGEQDRSLEGVRQIMERRVNAFGVSEPVIQVQGNNRISIQLPGVQNVDEAKALIGKTAKLDFRQQLLDASGQPVRDQNGQTTWAPATATGSDGQTRGLTGAYFKPNAQVIFSQTGQPEVSFELIEEGAKLFSQISGKLIQKPLGIFLDDVLISAPTVQAQLSDKGVITGMPLAEAQSLAIQLNAGALPVPVTIIKEQSVDAILGSDSVKKSIVAGEIGLAVVFLFMVLNYRLPGLLAASALIIYMIFLLAIFKLFPVTLTMAGIAAFIISLGMAVDANVLIFERMKEELRGGRTLASAIEAGFDRAWPSIWDSNVATFIIAGILWWFGSSFGASLIVGFAVTLVIGVALSMFSAITVTRTFMRVFMARRSRTSPWLLGLD